MVNFDRKTKKYISWQAVVRLTHGVHNQIDLNEWIGKTISVDRIQFNLSKQTFDDDDLCFVFDSRKKKLIEMAITYIASGWDFFVIFYRKSYVTFFLRNIYTNDLFLIFIFSMFRFPFLFWFSSFVK